MDATREAERLRKLKQELYPSTHSRSYCGTPCMRRCRSTKIYLMIMIILMLIMATDDTRLAAEGRDEFAALRDSFPALRSAESPLSPTTSGSIHFLHYFNMPGGLWIRRSRARIQTTFTPRASQLPSSLVRHLRNII